MRLFLKVCAGLLGLLVLGYFGAAVWFLRYGVDAHIIMRGRPAPIGQGQERLEFPAANGSPLSVRIAGKGGAGCVAVFPGNGGPIPGYEAAVVPRLVEQGIAVFLITYPGQQDTGPIAPLSETIELSRMALAAVNTRCEAHKLVVTGISLGSMVAAYAAPSAHPVGLLLGSASPSLSMAGRSQMKLNWLTRPLNLLPIERLLTRNWSVTEALAGSNIPRVVIFQGTADVITPLSDLLVPGALPPGIELITTEGAGHVDVFEKALPRYIGVFLDMLGIEGK